MNKMLTDLCSHSGVNLINNERHKVSDGVYLLLLMLPALVPTTNGFLHYSIAIFFSIIMLLLQPIKPFLYTLLLVFILYLLVFILMGSDFSSIRYVAFFMLLIACQSLATEQLFRAFAYITLICFIFSIFELLFPSGSFRLLFRSSLQEFHIARASGVFGFPGDLGHWAASTFILFFTVKPQVKISLLPYFNKIKNESWILICALSLFLLMVSQSRLAIIQLIISLILIGLRGAILKVSLVFIIGFISLYYVFDFSYIFSTDLLALWEAITNIGQQSKFKRVSDLALLYEGSAGFFPTALPSYVDFVESGFVSQVYRLGGLVSFLSIFFISIACAHSYLSKEKTHVLFSASVIVISLLVTNFVGAPFERPKLMFYMAILVGVVVGNSYRLSNKNTDALKKSN